MKTRILSTLVISALAALLWSGHALADGVEPYVVGFYWPVGDAYRCSLTVVSGDRWIAIMDITRTTLEVWEIADPAGWYHGLTNRFIHWRVSGSEYYVPPGGSLVGFGFNSSLAPVRLNWWMATDAGGVNGQAVLEFVPEPATLTALASLSLLTGGLLVRKQHVRQQKR